MSVCEYLRYARNKTLYHKQMFLLQIVYSLKRALVKRHGIYSSIREDFFFFFPWWMQGKWNFNDLQLLHIVYTIGLSLLSIVESDFVYFVGMGILDRNIFWAVKISLYYFREKSANMKKNLTMRISQAKSKPKP